MLFDLCLLRCFIFHRIFAGIQKKRVGRGFGLWTSFNLVSENYFWNIVFVELRVAEVGVLAETAKYPSMLAWSARLQIFDTKSVVFYN